MSQPYALFFGLYPGDERWIQLNPCDERVVVQVVYTFERTGRAETRDVVFERVFRHGYGLHAVYLNENATRRDRDAAIASRGFF